MADQNKAATYNNGPGNVPRLPDRVVDTLIDSADVSRCAPGRGCTVVDQTAAVERLVHGTCEELLARLPDLAAPAVPDMAGLTDERIYELVADHELRTRKLFGQVVFDSTTVLSFVRAIEREVLAKSPELLALHRQLAAETLRADQGWQRADAKSRECIELREVLATKASPDLSGLTRYGAKLTYVGNGHVRVEGIEESDSGGYVRLDDVQALLATPKGAEPAHPVEVAASDDDLQTIRDRDYNADMADKLAQGIAEHFGQGIGEHGSANCPWLRALDILNTKPEFAPCAGTATAPEKVAAPEGWHMLLEALYEFTKYAACSQQSNTCEFLAGLFEQIEALQPRCAAMLAVPPVPAPASPHPELTPMFLLNAALCIEDEHGVPDHKKEQIVAKLNRISDELQASQSPQPITPVPEFGASAGITPEYVSAQQAKNTTATALLAKLAPGPTIGEVLEDKNRQIAELRAHVAAQVEQQGTAGSAREGGDTNKKVVFCPSCNTDRTWPCGAVQCDIAANFAAPTLGSVPQVEEWRLYADHFKVDPTEIDYDSDKWVGFLAGVQVTRDELTGAPQEGRAAVPIATVVNKHPDNTMSWLIEPALPVGTKLFAAPSAQEGEQTAAQAATEAEKGGEA